MTERLRAWVRRHWPPLRLRTILFATLFLVAALPGFGAIFLRVYENTLVRQTETELVAQGAALTAAAAALWPGNDAPPAPPERLAPEPPRIDLNATPFLPERPAPVPAGPPDADARIAARRVSPVLLRTQATTLASLVLLDGRGRIVAGTAARGSYAALPEVGAALDGAAETVIRRNGSYRQVYRFEWLSRAAAIRVHHARPIVVGGRVVGVLLLSRSARALFRGLYEDRGKIAVGIAVIFVLLVLLTALLSRGIARPIEVLGAATRSVAAGGGQVPPPPATAAIEIQALYRDFAAMAQAIERRSRYLRDFAHAVSHEFKTPLAGIRGGVELLEDHDADMSAEQRRRFLANIGADAARLTLLVSRLLELARADMAATDRAATSVAPTLARVLADARLAGLTVDAHLPDDLVAVALPPASLERVVAALLDNARQAGAQRATIHGATEDDTVVLTIADDGPGIPPADRARVFEPFFTTRRASGGSGLGLAIVRSLLDAARATITLEDAASGTVFRLCLPAAVPRRTEGAARS